MLYDHSNAQGALVYDMDSGQQIKCVESVDTEQSCVTVFSQPIRIAEDGDTIVTEAMRFRAVHAIQGMELRPVLFHCYGRLA